MDTTTIQALQGTLTSPDYNPNNSKPWVVTNRLEIPIHAWMVSKDGILFDTGFVVAPNSLNWLPNSLYPDLTYYIWKEEMTGAFAFVTKTDYATDPPAPSGYPNSYAYEFTPDMLQQPGDIGPLPGTSAFPLPAGMLIPQDSPRVVVGCGQSVNGYLVRYQYWHSTDDSYSLPPGDKRTISLTTVTGMTDTTTDQTTVSSSVSTSASAGWGPVSASVSASLSTSSSTMHSFTITEQTTRFESIELNNFTTGIVTFMTWQLIDEVDIFANTSTTIYAPTASIICARLPKIYTQLQTPEFTPEKARNPSREERQITSAWRESARPVERSR